LACKLKLLHIKGHQDNGHPMVLLWEAWLDIETNLAAKSWIFESPLDKPDQSIPFEPWHLLINNEKIVKHHQHAIWVAMNGPAAQHYWTNKMPQVPQLHTELNVEAMERALSKSMLGRRRWVTKHNTSHFVHGKNMIGRGQQSTAQCPRCLAEMEDKLHILWCPAPSTEVQWTLSIQKLSQWMKDQGTALEIWMAILLQLERWAKDKPPQASKDKLFLENEQ